MGDWKWGLSPSCATYHALFPFSWTVFEEPLPGITVVIKQLSPFLPHSYSEASLPCSTLLVEVVNNDPLTEVEVSVMFSFQNGTEIRTDVSSKVSSKVKSNAYLPAEANSYNNKHLHRPFVVDDGSVNGIIMRGTALKTPDTENVTTSKCKSFDDTSFAIATSPSLLSSVPLQGETKCNNAVASICSRFVSARTAARNNLYVCASSSSSAAALDHEKYLDASASRLWRMFVTDGDIAEVLQEDRGQGYEGEGTAQAAAVCLRKTLQPLQKDLFPFALAWASPTVRFGGGDCFRRYFTRFFGHSYVLSCV